MRCPRCTHTFDLRDGQRFCTACAWPLCMGCEGCGQAAEPGDRCCAYCGAALGQAAEAPVRPAAELSGWLEAARARAHEAALRPAAPTRAHLDQADIDSLFG